jgi:hypothetical protein
MSSDLPTDEKKKRRLAKFVFFWITSWGVLLIFLAGTDLFLHPDRVKDALCTIVLGSGLIYIGFGALRRGRGASPVEQSEQEIPDQREQQIARKSEALGGPVAPIQGNPSTDIVTVATFQSLPQAEACKLYLESEGLTVFLSDTEMVRMDWLLSNALGSVKVQVPSIQVENAATLLERMRMRHDEQSKLTDDASCLACGAEMPLDVSQCQACGWSYSKIEKDDDPDGGHN